MTRVTLSFLAGALCGAFSCNPTARSGPTNSAPTRPATETADLSSAARQLSAPGSMSQARSASAPGVYRVPVGPPLTILPGEGLGPVRFGATLKTIERLMDAPCTEKVEDGATLRCRYQGHAVDYTLQDGVLTEIHVHGTEREFVPGKGLGLENTYGVFNGGFANGARLGMYPKFVGLGEPLRTENVAPGRFPTVEKRYYDGVLLEFDKLQNGNVVLGGVVLTKAMATKKPAGSPNELAPRSSVIDKPSRPPVKGASSVTRP